MKKPVKMPFTHVKTNEDAVDKQLHLSHLHAYVSAYQTTDATVKELADALVEGLAEAKRETRQVIVDQDGEHFFVCYPSGAFDLCIRWKSYRIVKEKE